MVVIECYVSFHPELLRDSNKLPSPVGSCEVVQSNETLTLVYFIRLDSLNNINLSVVCLVCGLACKKLMAIQVSMTTLETKSSSRTSTSVSGRDYTNVLRQMLIY